MTDSWKAREKAMEEDFFRKQEAAALEKIKARLGNKPRLSPISGKPMEQLTYKGVVIDRCSESGGIWLDQGELEDIVQAVKMEGEDEASQKSWIADFFNFLKKK